MAIFSPKQKVVLWLLVYSITASLLLTVAGQYFLHGDSVFNIGNRLINIVIASIALVLGVRDVLRVIQRAIVLATGNVTAFANRNQPSQESIPEYGYRDKWERENL